MMEMLTLTPAAMPAAIVPVAPDGGEAAVAPIDFSALLGTAQAAPPIVSPVAPTVGPTTVTPALTVTQGPAPEAADTEAPVGTPAVAPLDTIAVTVPVGLPEMEATAEPETPADPATAAIVAGVNLPTLPKDFVAQKPAKVAKQSPEEAAEDPATSDEEPEAPVAQAPCVAPLPIAPPVEVTQAPADAPIAAEIVTAMPPKAAPPPEPTPAPKAEAVPKLEQQAGAPVVVADAVAAALPKLREERPTREGIVVDNAVTAIERAAPTAQPITTDPIAAPAPQQQQQPLAPLQHPVAGLAQQATVILDDLFVASAADSAWVDRLASDITTLASGDQREARMKLMPRSLGDMDVRLEMDGRHTRVHFTVESPQAHQVLTDGAQRLTSTLEANGLKLDGATVDLDQRRSGGDADRRAPTAEQFETQRGTRTNRDSGGIAQAVARTRLATATERFA